MKWWGWAALVAVLALAVTLDQGFSSAQLLGGAAPVFTTGAALAVALTSRPAAAALAGFIAGWLLSSMVGSNVVQIIAPHVVFCFALASAKKLQVEMGPGPAFLWAAGAAVAIRVGTFLLAPPSDLLASLLMAPVSGGLTALAALPVYALLSRSAATEGP